MAKRSSQLPLKKEAAALAAFERDSNWLEEHRKELHGKYKGDFVAVRSQRVVDHDPDASKLIQRLRADGQDTSKFLIEVADLERKLILPNRP